MLRTPRSLRATRSAPGLLQTCAGPPPPIRNPADGTTGEGQAARSGFTPRRAAGGSAKRVGGASTKSGAPPCMKKKTGRGVAAAPHDRRAGGVDLSCQSLIIVLGHRGALGNEDHVHAPVARARSGVGTGVERLGGARGASRDAALLDATLLHQVVLHRLGTPPGDHVGVPLLAVRMTDDDHASAR